MVTPNIYNFELWKQSGHAAHYKENMFLIDVEKQEYGLKPMNCPGMPQLSVPEWKAGAAPSNVPQASYPEPELLVSCRMQGLLCRLLSAD